MLEITLENATNYEYANVGCWPIAEINAIEIHPGFISAFWLNAEIGL